VLNRAGARRLQERRDGGTISPSSIGRLDAHRRESGGQFFYQPKSVAMGEVIQVIDKAPRSRSSIGLTVRVPEVFQPFRDRRLVFLLLGSRCSPGAPGADSRSTAAEESTAASRAA